MDKTKTQSLRRVSTTSGPLRRAEDDNGVKVLPSRSSETQSGTMESQVPAAIRVDESHVSTSLPPLPSPGRYDALAGPRKTVTTQTHSLTSRPLASDRLRLLATPSSSPVADEELMLSAIRRIDAIEAPQRLTTLGQGRAPVELICADARVMPTGRALDEPRENQLDALVEILLRVAQNNGELVVQPLPADDAQNIPDDRWLRATEILFRWRGTTPIRALVDKLRAALIELDGTFVVLRRARDKHPLLRIQNVRGAEHLSTGQLESLVRFGENMSRQLAVLSSAAIPGANRWFGAVAGAGMGVISAGELTFVGAFALDKLGRAIILADAIETTLRGYEHRD